MGNLSSKGDSALYRPEIIAHRGASGYLPEHTLEAKAMAYAFLPDYIEQDVVLSKDGIPVVLHDHTLETTTDVAKKFSGRNRRDGSYYAIDFTLAELKSLIVTERFNPETQEAVFSKRFPLGWGIDFRIPTLEEEFLLIQGLNKSTGHNIGVYVEVKESSFHDKEGQDALQKTIDMLTDYGYNAPNSQAVLQIFDYEAVRISRDKGWKGQLAMLIANGGQTLKDDKERHKWLLTEEGIADIAKYATIYAPWFSHLAVPNADGESYTISKTTELAKKQGMKVHSWTHRSDALLKGFKDSSELLDVAFKQLKIDGLFSDFPDKAMNYLRQNKLR